VPYPRNLEISKSGFISSIRPAGIAGRRTASAPDLFPGSGSCSARLKPYSENPEREIVYESGVRLTRTVQNDANGVEGADTIIDRIWVGGNVAIAKFDYSTVNNLNRRDHLWECGGPVIRMILERQFPYVIGVLVNVVCNLDASPKTLETSRIPLHCWTWDIKSLVIGSQLESEIDALYVPIAQENSLQPRPPCVAAWKLPCQEPIVLMYVTPMSRIKILQQ